MLKQRKIWIIVVISLLAIGVIVLKKRQAAVAPPVATAAKAASTLEFLPGDILTLQPGELSQALVLTGSLRAVKQAQVKSKVSGEVREVLVREGEMVKAGQVLVTIDASEYQARLEQARGSLLAARGQLAIATKARDNNKALVAQGFISQNAFDNAASQYDIARANLASAQGMLDVAQKGLNDTVVRAPLEGTIASRAVQPGEKVSVDNRLLEILDLRQLEMEAAAPVADILQLTPGKQVKLSLEGLPDPLTGKLTRISPTTQAGSRSVMTYIQIDNPQGLLKAGMFGEAQIIISSKSNVLSVPPVAVHDQASKPFVYTIVDDTLRQQAVSMGMRGHDRHGEAVEILEGLTAGSVIVKSNLGKLPNGAKVRTTSSNPTPVAAR